MIALFGSALKHKSLIRDLVIRDISARYKGTLLGMVWALLNPLLMLGLYTFFFTLILKSKWGVGDTQANYGLMLFCGLIVHGWMAEVLSRSPDLLSSNRNYVKKSRLPVRHPGVDHRSILSLPGISQPRFAVSVGITHGQRSILDVLFIAVSTAASVCTVIGVRVVCRLFGRLFS